MAKQVKRFGWLLITVVFFISSFGVTGLVVYQIIQDNKAAKLPAEVQKQLDAQKAANDAKKSADQTNKPQEGKLKGTKLANFSPVASVDSLQKIDLTVGTGSEVKPGDKVTVNYTGAIASDGTIFESSLDTGQPATFGLDQVIKGWTDGIPGMKVGGKRRLIIPSAQAYGANGSGNTIPPNSNLVFDVELISIGQ